MSPPSGDGAPRFAEKILTLLGEGRFTASYKYAVLLALIDLCLEASTRSGAPPTSVSTTQLAEKVLELYWGHTLPYREGHVLRQSRPQARVLSLIAAFQEEDTGAGRSVAKARRLAPERFARLLRDVEWVLVEMPIAKLQRIGRDLDPFIYTISWDDGVSRGQFNSPAFDNLLRFVGGAAEHLLRMSGLLRPLIQREWARLVATKNSEFIEQSRLEDFLFGVQRTSTAALRRDLRQLQRGRCFYCGEFLSASAQVDHFVPWARYPDDGLDNLLLAHQRCNSAKRDHFAAVDHLRAWVERSDLHTRELTQIAQLHGWQRDVDRTRSVSRALYLRLPEDAWLWWRGRQFRRADPVRIRTVLA